MRLKIGSRKSDLARLQAQHVGALLKAAHSDLTIEYDFSESLGDKNLEDPLWKAPEKGLFTSDLALALEQGAVDLVVHSWKDMPIEEGTLRKVAGTCQRADPRDLLLVKKSALERIAKSGRIEIFSSSPRREYCLKKYLPEIFPMELREVRVSSVRGNIPTRVRKLMENSEVDALMVAKAALDRLIGATEAEFRSVGDELSAAISQCQWMVLPLSQFPTAPAQGALAIEILKSREDLEKILAPVIDFSETERVRREREVLKSYGGGCHQKIGCTLVESRSGIPVEYLVGLTDQGEILFRQGVLNKKAAGAPVWSSQAWDADKRRCELAIGEINQELLLVAKAQALPQNFSRRDDQILWVAGVSSWKKLARRGVWVNGSADGLGLTVPKLEFLKRKPASQLLLTHHRADLEPDMMATYQVLWAKTPATPKLPKEQPIFIRSRMDFEMAQQLGLFDEPRIVYCGVGETYLFLEKQKHLFKELRPVLSQEDV